MFPNNGVVKENYDIARLPTHDRKVLKKKNSSCTLMHPEIF